MIKDRMVEKMFYVATVCKVVMQQETERLSEQWNKFHYERLRSNLEANQSVEK